MNINSASVSLQKLRVWAAACYDMGSEPDVKESTWIATGDPSSTIPQ